MEGKVRVRVRVGVGVGVGVQLRLMARVGVGVRLGLRQGWAVRVGDRLGRASWPLPLKRTAGKALNMAVMPLCGSHSSSGVICLGVWVRVRVRA